jgi:hypothetical protein
MILSLKKYLCLLPTESAGHLYKKGMDYTGCPLPLIAVKTPSTVNIEFFQK